METVPVTPERGVWREHVPWLVALAAGLVGMLAAAAHRPFWTDENISIHYASLPLGELWRALLRGSDGMLPGFYLLTHAWIAYAGGVDELVTRAPGILFFGAGAAVFLYTVARLLGGAAAAWASLPLLFSGVPDLLDLRSYNWLVGGLAMALAAVLRWPEERPGRLLWLGHAALQIVIWSLHPFAFLYGGAVAAGVVFSGRRWRAKAVYLSTFLPAALLLALWLPSLRHLAQINEPWNWIPRPNWILLLRTCLCLPRAVAGLLVTGLAAAAFASRGRLERRLPRSVWYACAAIGALPLGLWLISQVGTVVFLPRYCRPLLLVWSCLVAGSAGWLQRYRAPEAISAAVWPVVLVMAASTLAQKFSSEAARNGRDLAALLAGEQERGSLPPDATIFCESPHAFLPRAYYYSGHCSYYYVVDLAMARSGHDFLGASVDANLMSRMRESGCPHVIDAAEAEALAARLGHVYLIKDPQRKTLEALTGRLEQNGWQSRDLMSLSMPIDESKATLRELYLAAK